MNISSVNSNAAVAPAPSQTAVSKEQSSLIQAVKVVNSAGLFGLDNELTFVMDRASHQPVVRIVNKSTRELVAQIPSQSVLQLADEVQRSR